MNTVYIHVKLCGSVDLFLQYTIYYVCVLSCDLVFLSLPLSNSYQAGFFAVARNRAGEWTCMCASNVVYRKEK